MGFAPISRGLTQFLGLDEGVLSKKKIKNK